MNTKLIAIDLDGTTLNNQSLLTPRTIVTLQRLQRAGHHVLIATGRPLRNSKDIYQEIGLKSPMVNFNGALCHSPQNEKWKDSYHKTLDIDLAMDLLENKDYLGVDWICVEGKEKLYSSYETIPTSFLFPKNTHSTHLSTHTLLEERPTALTLFMDESKQESVRAKLLAKYGSDLISVRTWGGKMPCLEIVASGIQKAMGVEVVAHSYGIKKDHILAFGDEDNDFEMIDYVGHGVAMKNGIDKLKAIANDITQHTNDEDGLALYLEKYFNM